MRKSYTLNYNKQAEVREVRKKLPYTVRDIDDSKAYRAERAQLELKHEADKAVRYAQARERAIMGLLQPTDQAGYQYSEATKLYQDMSKAPKDWGVNAASVRAIEKKIQAEGHTNVFQACLDFFMNVNFDPK